MNPLLVYDDTSQNVVQMDSVAKKYPVRQGLTIQSSCSCGGSIPLRLRYTLRECHWDVAPNLYGENYSGREQ
jgi:hypothetical protein